MLLLARFLVLLACLGCLGCAPDPGWVDVTEVSFRRAEDTDPGAWHPAAARQVIGKTRSKAIWLRATTPAVSVPDPALHLSHGRLVSSVIVDGSALPMRRSQLIFPVSARGSVVLIEIAAISDTVVPSMRVGAQRSMWVWTLYREVPHGIIGGLVLVAGLLMLAAAVVRRGPKAYFALGVFLSSLGTLTILNLRNLSTLLQLSNGQFSFLHHTATLLYPAGFVQFALATFGDGRWAILRRGFMAYLVYAGIVVVLHVSGVADLDNTRLGAGLFVILFACHGIVLALRLSRRGDPRGKPFLAGIALLLAFGLYDIFRTTLEFQLLPFGLLAFGIAMVLVLETQFTQARMAAQASAAELSRKLEALQERNREVQSLNTELRHQIAERSRQMVYLLQSDAGLVRESRLLKLGEVVGERYRIVSVLGRGGMGAVYEVERTSDGKRLALKVMAGAASPVAAARFAREAEIAARIIDEHLVPVLDISGPDSDTLYLVMDLVVGQSLEDARGRFGDVSWGLGILTQIARGLVALHAAGVVHRDLKPANVLLSPQPDGSDHVRIADFGISHLESAPLPEQPETLATDGSVARGLEPEAFAPPEAGAQHAATIASGADDTLAASSSPQRGPSTARPRTSTPALTATGVIMGTPAYMAPELVGGARTARPSADMFAFGLIAFEVLSGRSAYDVPPSQMIFSSRTREPSGSMPPGVPQAVRSMVLHCLEFDPAGRPSARDALAALEAAGPQAERASAP